MTEFTNWKDSDDVAPLRGSTTGHAPIPPRAHLREDTVGVPHPLRGLHREDIAGGLVPVLHPERTGRTRSLKPLNKEAPPPNRAVGAPPKLRWMTTKEIPDGTGTINPQDPVAKRTSAALCPRASGEPTSLAGWKNL